MIKDIVIEFLVESGGVERSKFEDPDLLIADLGVDSLGMIEMLFEVEDRFDFQFDDPAQFSTLKFTEMVTILEEQIKEHHGGVIPEIPDINKSNEQDPE